MDDFESIDGMAQGALVRSGEVTAAELVEAALARIAERDRHINAVVTHIEPRYPGPEAVTTSPFTGVPFLVKDLVAEVDGTPMTSGSRLTTGHVSDHDSELVRRLRRGGLILIGKTNVPEFGILGTTESRLLGACRNPWHLEYSVGGSSGGAAAAVAARMVPMAHGSDGGGSIRIPASCCGVFGLKPSRARNPLGPDYGDLYAGLAVEHALTISVRDSAALLDLTAGPDLGDPYAVLPPQRPFVDEIGRDPGQLRIALSLDLPAGMQLHPDCRSAAEDAAHLCESLGHQIIEASPPLPHEQVNAWFDTIWTASVAATIDGWLTRSGRSEPGELIEPLTAELYQRGRLARAADYVTAITELQRVTRAVAGFFTEYDVLLSPTLTLPPPRLGWFDHTVDDPLRGYRRDAWLCAFNPLANLTGQPSMSVPTSWNNGGLPTGTQYTAAIGAEATLFRLAAQLEAARPWANRLPPLLTPHEPAEMSETDG
jgi:amidase